MPAAPVSPPYKPQTPEEACKDAPDYDPAAQHWYYWKAESDGSKTKMVQPQAPNPKPQSQHSRSQTRTSKPKP